MFVGYGQLNLYLSCADPDSLSEGSNYDIVFFPFVHEGRRGERIQYHYMRAIIGTPAKRH